MRLRMLACSIGPAILAILLSACTTTTAPIEAANANGGELVTPTRPQTQPEHYRFYPGDELSVRAVNRPELTITTRVDPYGYIVYPYIGPVLVKDSRNVLKENFHLVAFAGLTGDYSELHTSDVYAKSSQFGRRVAHGMLGLAYAHGLMWARTGELRETGGRLDQLPVPGVRIGAADVPGDRHWPRVLFFPRVADLEQALEGPVESRIVLLDADRPDGYERVWRPALEFPPERHLGYAVQWFALAVVAFVIFVALSVKRISPPDTPRP